jgi:ABC-type molybdate transport system substrate-binding protein
MATKKLKWVLFGILLISAWILGTAVQATSAGEIQVISSVGMKAVLEEIRSQFERTTGHTLAITFGTSVPLKRQIDAGKTFDVVVLTPSLVVMFQTNQGKKGVSLRPP